jgi:predicted component of type VI protein secretion system
MTRARLDAIRRGWVDANYEASPTELHVGTLKQDIEFLLAELERVTAANTTLEEALEAARTALADELDHYVTPDEAPPTTHRALALADAALAVVARAAHEEGE